ncbi:881_t:CDS:2 [Diversispora eburnea]|uniref:881_t:CDS:1 n=1 Tax=Diversispora eburnea TaxID=1213867 RepID=A0A9N9G7S1_9GLOM|nr:881_t:CDS:2 [Diversispora eburnea]
MLCMAISFRAGTSLPGFLCASLSPENLVILTDRSDSPQILENIREGSKLNGFLINSSPSLNITSSNEAIINSNEKNDDDENVRQKSEKGGGLFKLLRDIEQLGRKLDWILGSDTFYDPKEENNENYFSKSHNNNGGGDDDGSKKYSSSLQSIFLLEIWKI